MATQKFDDTYEFPHEIEAKKLAEEKLEIEIEDDTPPEDRGRKPMKEPVDEVTDEELASYDEKVQKRIKKFTRGYHDERRAKEQALREREELDAAKEKYKKAYEAADPDSIVQAQEAIARATLKIDRAESMKPIKNEEREFQPPAREDDEAPRVSPRTQKWVKHNSDWWGVDEEMTMTAMGIDKKLQREYGADYVGTEEYFQTIDKTMRKRFPEHFESDQSYEEDEPPPKKRTSEPVDEDDYDPPRRATRITSPVAPASRSTPPNRIRLKASEAAQARRLGVPIEEYARQVALLRKGA